MAAHPNDDWQRDFPTRWRHGASRLQIERPFERRFREVIDHRASAAPQEEATAPTGALFEFTRTPGRSWLGVAIDAAAIFIMSIVSGLVGYHLTWLGQHGAALLYEQARLGLQTMELYPITLTSTLPQIVAGLCGLIGFGFALGEFRLRDVV